MTGPADIPVKLLWLDLEMTGLDPDKDLILEVAAAVTDFDFETLASYESRVRGGARRAVASRLRANAWWQDFPANRDDFLANLDSAKPPAVVEDELVGLVKQHFGDEPAVLAGNSIHCDRAFIRRWWPTLDRALHYRMLDVSAFKVLMQGKFGVIYDKPDVHRAFDDMRASIAELRHYLTYFKYDAPGS